VVTNTSGCNAQKTDTVSMPFDVGVNALRNSISGIVVYPNPFEGSTNIAYTLLSTTAMNISIYDITGKQVAKLKEGTFPAGDYNEGFNAGAQNMPPGIYLLRITTNDSHTEYKIVIR
jgi:hypothetical protein